MKRNLKNRIYSLSRILFSLFPLQKAVFFKAYNGNRYACNPRAISEYLHAVHPEIKIIWCFKDEKKDIPDYIKTVKKNTLKELFALWTSKIWVFNAGIILSKKRKGQCFIDTWHGDRAFKCVETSSDKTGKLADAYKLADTLLVGSDYGEMVAKKAMQFQGQLLRIGSPRNDLFFKENKNFAKKIKENLGLSKYEKLLLFAPTFRNAEDDAGELRLSELLDKLEQRDFLKWGALMRSHYKVRKENKAFSDERIKDVSDYEEIQHLLLVSDIVISDYSSLVGDFCLLKRPVFLYVPDLETYRNGRGLYFDLEKSPFFYAKTEAELFELILKTTETEAKTNAENILKFYGNVREDGSASKQVAELIWEKLNAK